MKRLSLLTAAALSLGSLAACGTDDEGANGGQGGSDGRLTVVASFYPLEHAAAKVGGDHVDVTNLTTPGAEAHDLELSPKDMLEVTKADLLVYLKDFQPAVDDAAHEAGESALDVTESAHLVETSGADEHEHADEHAEEEGHEGHDHGPTDPHFWLDPMRYADVADAIAERLASADPDHAADFRANAKNFRDELTALDREMSAGLKECTHRELVTSHTAFGYLAEAYDLDQEGITGLTPESEPSAKAMAEVVAHINEHGVSTIYTEPLAPRAVAKTIATEVGVKVATLDPLEGITDQSAAQDYLGVMRANLETLREGQECR